MLVIYDTHARQKREFVPLNPNEVRMYVCGMTVYDRCHIGHARVMVVFDMVTRYLRERGYQVTYVRNITDIDDKIIARAAQNKESIQALTERFITAMHDDAAALGCQPPDLEPRATESVDDMVTMIQTLIDRGHAYRADNGDVYFDVSTFDRYGELSGRHLEDLRAGARVEVDEAKSDPLDFVLWKAAKPGDPSWPAPFGSGRPGWHIECSAMSTRALGNHFDIHGGGQDLQFPHHENEIAQSECATGCHYVNYWMHNGFVRINEEKMSKSLGNFFTVAEVMARYHPEVIRFFILNSHYRSPLNYSEQNLDAARTSLTRWYTALKDAPVGGQPIEAVLSNFHEVMCDDFNTPEALALVFEQITELNRLKTSEQADERARAADHAATLQAMGRILNLGQGDAEAFLRWAPESAAGNGLDDAAIEQKIAERTAARKNKDFATSDRIRDELQAAGVILEDSAGVTTWRRG
ncbi:cysteine--tRNA ligase [Halothiobacillus diazotrophicus]|uniref:Cysteine--tRNA ligase n=1 Tax=Halothiobacillus diazotrophicus TaxID=1860122 RepID=A0A191ZET5_9GAMM|nr:cysteine--tRNA ligase [Halothiobacillus diazotrophicus]ANJ66383.1 cysteine--tRNA ligase [Halothiobacillus diazotrophicus]